MSDTSDLFEVMHTARAMRRLKPDPVGKFGPVGRGPLVDVV
jgi:hypothetical protein